MSMLIEAYVKFLRKSVDLLRFVLFSSARARQKAGVSLHAHEAAFLPITIGGR